MCLCDLNIVTIHYNDDYELRPKLSSHKSYNTLF